MQPLPHRIIEWFGLEGISKVILIQSVAILLCLVSSLVDNY